MKRKQPKRVRCWMVTYPDGSRSIRTGEPDESKVFTWDGTITSGYFVPDESKPKRKGD